MAKYRFSPGALKQGCCQVTVRAPAITSNCSDVGQNQTGSDLCESNVDKDGPGLQVRNGWCNVSVFLKTKAVNAKIEHVPFL